MKTPATPLCIENIRLLASRRFLPGLLKLTVNIFIQLLNQRSRLTIVTLTDNQPSWYPKSDLSAPAGFIAPAKIQTNLDQQDFEAISQAASKILKNPLEVRRLADQVYQLMQDDLRLQSDRSGNYRSWR